MAENLPEEDPKFDQMMTVIREKQTVENNKIIIFSTFRFTLGYLKNKLVKAGFRVDQVDGSVKDVVRQDLRARFELSKTNPEALDILLFTEVGSEGLDYQFCDMMINYDLPWNPMRIEQRIGRIDRRGQKSEAVNIYNVITKGTVDADIYYRCIRWMEYISMPVKCAISRFQMWKCARLQICRKRNWIRCIYACVLTVRQNIR